MGTWIRRLVRSAQGSTLVVVALAAMAVVGSVGVAIDVGRSQMVAAKLQSSVDAAGLAAGATLNTANLGAVATKYVQLNFSQGIIGATLGQVTTTLSNDNKKLTVVATAELPTTVTHIFGKSKVTVNASTEITRSNKGLELAMVLDTTGSMAGTKLTALKTAAHDLTDILFGTGATADNLWVGLVPFTMAVNVGASHTDWLDAAHFAGLDWATTSWGGCVDARYSAGRDITDDPPFDLAHAGAAVPAAPYERLKAFYWADDANNNWEGSSSSSTKVCNKKASCVCGATYVCACNTVGYATTCTTCSGFGSSASCTATTTTRTFSISSTKGPNKYCPSSITPLTNVKATVSNGIDALVANGNTHVNLGAVWGWRLISPRWRGYWGGTMNTNNLPLDYNAPLMSKAVIIMTDGTNTMSSNVRSAYGYLSEGHLGTTTASLAEDKLDTKLTSVCNAMKTQGIIVYTVLFQESDNTIKTLLRNCATNPDYFFDSPTEDALKTAFHTIGDSLANLRISK